MKKSKRVMALILAALLIMSSTACGSNIQPAETTAAETVELTVPESPEKVLEEVTGDLHGVWYYGDGRVSSYKKSVQMKFIVPEALKEQYDAANAAFKDVTAEQFISDYESFWTTLRENYGFWGVVERSGIDADSVYESGKKLVNAYPNACGLYGALTFAVTQLGGYGHLSVLDPLSYDNYYKQIYHGFTPWGDIYESQKVTDNISSWKLVAEYMNASADEQLKTEDSELEAAKSWANEHYGSSVNMLGTVEPSDEYPHNENVVTGMLGEDGKTAYMACSTFTTWEQDKKTVTDFLKTAKDAENLIIDIRGNGGGDVNYWYQMYEYLSDQSMEYTKYSLSPKTDYCMPFINRMFGNDGLRPVSELPESIKPQQSDIDCAPYFAEQTVKLTPTKNYTGFKGKIWLLIDGSVYSASESFAIFCKDSGFATLIGRPTGGDGCAIDPLPYVCPYSGLLTRFSAMNVLNGDGSSNEEIGTMPDILVEDGQNIIDIVLAEIAKQ